MIGYGDWTEPFVRSEPWTGVSHQERGVRGRKALVGMGFLPEANMAILGYIRAILGHFWPLGP